MVIGEGRQSQKFELELMGHPGASCSTSHVDHIHHLLVSKTYPWLDAPSNMKWGEFIVT